MIDLPTLTILVAAIITVDLIYSRYRNASEWRAMDAMIEREQERRIEMVQRHVDGELSDAHRPWWYDG